MGAHFGQKTGNAKNKKKKHKYVIPKETSQSCRKELPLEA